MKFRDWLVLFVHDLCMILSLPWVCAWFCFEWSLYVFCIESGPRCMMSMSTVLLLEFASWSSCLCIRWYWVSMESCPSRFVLHEFTWFAITWVHFFVYSWHGGVQTRKALHENVILAWVFFHGEITCFFCSQYLGCLNLLCMASVSMFPLCLCMAMANMAAWFR